jgi:hypothetical protein
MAITLESITGNFYELYAHARIVGPSEIPANEIQASEL